MIFEYKGKTIEISEGKLNYWCMKHDYNFYLAEAINNFKKNYNATGNLKNLIDKPELFMIIQLTAAKAA